ncbi:hypothetical protein MTBPR1_180005 [Candidatus Terasakiella magnetica]|uniref:Uncharacterized protein n=1 Tax=Candidatus Terasakiella magnetica TaxID=1867952 RepID=A0A1C3RFV0_9PROT|nr:hypothetical protein [Candidatus Terasakiella magnetica]SCA56092.1 hypothetical protein MTBPR1_180005 [Candidatus Terasakiella magnetica]
MANDPKDPKNDVDELQFDMLGGSDPAPKENPKPKAKPAVKKTPAPKKAPVVKKAEEKEPDQKVVKPAAKTPRKTTKTAPAKTAVSAKKTTDEKKPAPKVAAKPKAPAKAPAKATTKPRAKPKPAPKKKAEPVKEPEPEPVSALLQDAFSASPWAGALMGQGAQPIVMPEEIIHPEVVEEPKAAPAVQAVEKKPEEKVEAVAVVKEEISQAKGDETTQQTETQVVEKMKAPESEPVKEADEITVKAVKVDAPAPEASPVFKNARGVEIDSPWLSLNNEPAKELAAEPIVYKAHGKPVEQKVVMTSGAQAEEPQAVDPYYYEEPRRKGRLKRGERKAMRARNIEHWLNEKESGGLEASVDKAVQPSVTDQAAVAQTPAPTPHEKPQTVEASPWRKEEVDVPQELAKAPEPVAQPRRSKRKKQTVWTKNSADQTMRLSERNKLNKADVSPKEIAVEGVASGIINVLGDGVELVVDTAKGAVASIGEQPTRRLDDDEILVENIARGTVDALGSGVEAIVDAGACAGKGVAQGVGYGVQSVKDGASRLKNAGSGAVNGFVDGIKKPTSSKD